MNWTNIHQKSFDEMKKVMAKETILNYPDFNKTFEIHTDASDTTTEKELLSIVETLKEFRNILLGQKIKIYTDHKSFVHESEIKTSQHVMCRRLLLEKYGPEIVYIKGKPNIVADALSRLPRQGDIVEDIEAVLQIIQKWMIYHCWTRPM